MATVPRIAPEEIIALILGAETITDDVKAGYVDRIMKGEFTPEMQKELAKIFYAEMRLRERKIAEVDSAIADFDAEMEQEWKEVEPEMQALTKDYDEECATIVSDYDMACDKIDQKAERGMEGAIREGEQTEADAIRQSLKKASGGDQA